MKKNNEKVQIQDNEAYQNYEILDVVGTGTFGKVFLVKHIVDNNLYAMKHVLQNKKYKNRELQIMLKIQSENVVKLVNHFYNQQKKEVFLNLIMQYIPTTLSKIIKTNYISKEFLNNEKIKLYAKNLLLGLKDLHKDNICHRDIKPSNILIGQDTAKYCDFGSAKLLTPGQKNISYICSRYYRAPELLLGATFYNTQIDIWSLGCVIAQMLTNRSLFEGTNSTSMLVKIVKTIGCPTPEDLIDMKLESYQIDIVQTEGCGVKSKISKMNPNSCPELMNLIEQMIRFSPQKRISAQKALELPLFNS